MFFRNAALAGICTLALPGQAVAATTIRKTLHVGTTPIHWQTKPVPNNSSSDIQIRVDGHKLLIETDSICSGTAWRGDLVVRVNACGKGASPVKFSAVRMGETTRRKTVRLRVVVTGP